MTTLADLKPKRVFKGFGCGYPGSGKTGSLASLINTGKYNVRILSLDSNLDPLFEYVKPEFLAAVEVVKLKENLVPLQDKMTFQTPPQVFAKAMSLLYKWKYKDEDGNEIDHGHVRTWGPDDVLVIDPLTRLATAAMDNTLKLRGRLDTGPRWKEWYAAQQQLDMMMGLLGSDDVPCNVIVFAHLRLIGPKDIEEVDAKDEFKDDIKKQRAKLQELVAHRLFPSAVGKAQPPLIAGFFPYTLYYTSEPAGGGLAKRVIETQPREDFDVKVPLARIPKRLDISDGLAKIFAAVRGEKPW